jgi:hypothetical protein
MAGNKVRRVIIKSLTNSQNEKRRVALDVIGIMRREKRSLTAVSREVGVSPLTVRKYAGTALDSRTRQHRPKKSDRLRRDLRFYDGQGEYEIVTHSSKTASLISNYHHAVSKFVNPPHNDTLLKDFEGKYVVAEGRRHYFLTDRAALRKLERSGVLNFLDIYGPGTNE